MSKDDQLKSIEKVTKIELMRERDEICASPEQRAAYIWAAVNRMNPKPTTWDIICFCAEAFAAISAGDHTFLQPFAKRLISIVYTAHYHTPDPHPSALHVEPTVKSDIIEIVRNDSFLR